MRYCGLVVKSFKSRDKFADENCRACFHSNVFNIHTTVKVETLHCSSFIEVFLIDICIQIKQDKQTSFLRTYCRPIREFVPLD